MKESIKQFLYLLDEQARKSIPFLLFGFILTSVLDVIGVGLIGIFLGLLTNPQFLFHKFPQLTHVLQQIPEKKLIYVSGISIVCIFILKALITLIIQNKIISFCQIVFFRLKERLMTAYQYAPYLYHLQKNSAHLISVMQYNLSAYIGNVLLPLLNVISSTFIALSIIVFLSLLHPSLTAFLVAMFLSVSLIFDLFVKRKLSAMGQIVALSNGESNKIIYHGLHGMIEVRVLGKENYFIESLNKISHQYSHAATVLVTMQQIPRFLIENMIAIFIVGLSLGSIAFGYVSDSVVAMVGMFAAAGARLMPAVTQILTSTNQIRGNAYQTKLVYDELHELDSLDKNLKSNKLKSSSVSKMPFNEFSLKNVSYQYPGTNASSLDDVNISVTKGQSIGLIGPSGAGKSTLVNLILSFLTPQSGNIFVDDKPIENTREWLNNFAYIPQVIFLLDDTIRRNIAFGIEDKDIDDARVWNAIKMAQLTEVVQQLPEGLNTMIGENGIRLSGGQRQRVALARAFYHERDVIIMDEATSALDNETEKEVINTIKHLKGNKTLIVIAHRLSTVEHCDVLYRLERGRVTAVGSFDEVVGSVA